MRRLGTTRIPIHHIPHQIRTNHTRIPRHLLGHPNRRGQHILGPIAHLAKQAIQQLVLGFVRGARGDEVDGFGVAEEPGEEEGTAGFHDEAAAREDEADFGGPVGDADAHGEGHGGADADGGALDGGYDGLFALVDREGDAAAAGWGGGLVGSL